MRSRKPLRATVSAKAARAMDNMDVLSKRMHRVGLTVVRRPEVALTQGPAGVSHQRWALDSPCGVPQARAPGRCIIIKLRASHQ